MLSRIRRLVNQVKYRGDRRECPVCGSHLSQFLPLPESYRRQQREAGFDLSLDRFETLHMEEYLCPVCGESDRSRLFALYIMGSVPTERDWRLLDIAPTRGLSTFLKQLKGISYRSFDLASNLADDHGDIQEMPYDDDWFDWVICSHVLEHVPDDLKAVQEIGRILKPEGRAILMAPVHLDLEETREDRQMWSEEQTRLRWFGQDDHLRLYARLGFTELIRAAGMRVEISVALDIHSNVAQFGIDPSSVLYVGLPETDSIND